MTTWLMAGTDALPAMAEGQVTVTVSDCGSRVNLNLADKDALLALFAGQKESRRSRPSWTGATPTTNRSEAGAEKDYYQGLTPPLRPGQRLF